ncbi:hypothetical protein [uncultured Azohydromonas sp.]|uniref:hypothetical protein n=1 Tax=uncultured Azohydromonas sp. TaxID=487342 RepID=UPI002626E7F3|nr:hypothetical protein [uncultured Azohydromonas sp.]
MPAPTAQPLEGLATAALQGAGLRGRNIPDLAKALAQATSQALTLFLGMAMVLPGTAAGVDPITGSGAVAGPGRLAPPPAGGPGAQQLEGLTLAALQAQGLRGENIPDLAKAVAASLAQAILMFTSQVMVTPGVAVAGFVTVAPGTLMPPAPGKAQLEPLVSGFVMQNGLRGQDAPALAGALADFIAQSLTLLVAQAMVAPGVACTPAATAAPGRLM